MTSPSAFNPIDLSANPLLGAASGKTRANAAASSAAGSGTSAAGSSNNSQTSLSSLGSTFLTLLTQELQNQDPTSPMDSTQIVGQMISLNQLDQLASINQLLTTTFGAASTASSTSNPGIGDG